MLEFKEQLGVQDEKCESSYLKIVSDIDSERSKASYSVGKILHAKNLVFAVVRELILSHGPVFRKKAYLEVVVNKVRQLLIELDNLSPKFFEFEWAFIPPDSGEEKNFEYLRKLHLQAVEIREENDRNFEDLFRKTLALRDSLLEVDFRLSRQAFYVAVDSIIKDCGLADF